MAVERATSGSSLIDVLDRVLDKGIVIDAWVRVSLVGIDLITVEARIVGQVGSASRPQTENKAYDELAAENATLRAQLHAKPVRRRAARRR